MTEIFPGDAGAACASAPAAAWDTASQKPDRDATEARAEAVGGTGAQEKVYERRHAHEIERAENIAAGLPPEGAPPEPAAAPVDKKEFREPNLETACTGRGGESL